MHSQEFTELWPEHRVRAWDIAAYRMRHPLVGPWTSPSRPCRSRTSKNSDSSRSPPWRVRPRRPR
ncbi:hypothetical protein [Streptacidiphilus sp. EB129]|uniref:hypothetical protein n=1 Tax=Streptacidiphilus sp. EB129 TaxID=3156262 RepID=UPI00351721AC